MGARAEVRIGGAIATLTAFRLNLRLKHRRHFETSPPLQGGPKARRARIRARQSIAGNDSGAPNPLRRCFPHPLDGRALCPPLEIQTAGEDSVEKIRHAGGDSVVPIYRSRGNSPGMVRSRMRMTMVTQSATQAAMSHSKRGHVVICNTVAISDSAPPNRKGVADATLITLAR